MNKKRFILLLLCFCLILPVMVSCKDDDDDDRDHDFIYDYDDSSREKAMDSVPEGYDLKGQTVGIFYADHVGETVIGREDMEGERHLVYSKIYERNAIVEDRLNVDLEFIPSQTAYWADVTTVLKNYFQTADGSIEVVMSTANTIVATNLVNYFWSVNDSYYIDLEEDWWYEDAIMETSVDGQEMRVLYGDINIGAYGNAGTIYYNKDLYEQYLAGGKGRDYLYQLVLEGKWTLDYYYQLTKKSHIELGEDGIQDDIMGFVLKRAGEPLHYLPIACGVEYYTRDPDTGMPTITLMNGINQSKALDIFDQLNKLVHQNPGHDGSLLGKMGAELEYPKSFEKNDYVFHMGTLLDAMSDDMREMQSDYGMLPYPKYDAEQTEYISFMNSGTTLVGIPRTVTEDRMIEEVSAVVECLASESYRYVSVAFFETALKGVYSRDDMDSQMIDIIMAQHETIPSKLTKNFLYEYADCLKGVGTIFMRLIVYGNGNTTMKSNYDEIIDAEKVKIQQLYQNYKEGVV